MIWIKRHGKKERGGRYTCNYCGEVVWAQGGRFRDHLKEKHGQEEGEKERKEREAVEALVAKDRKERRERQARATVPAVDALADAERRARERSGLGVRPPFPAVAPVGEPLPEGAEELEAELKGLSRVERLRSLLALVEDEALPGQARVAAEGLIARYQGYLDNPPEEEFEKKEERWMKLQEREVARLGGVEGRLRELLRDPVRRGELRRMLEEAEKEAAKA